MGKNGGKKEGLGRSLIKDNSRKLYAKSKYHTTELEDGAKWTKFQSVTDQTNLDEFFSNAQLAGTEFAAERQNVTIVSNDYNAIPTEQEEKAAVERINAHKHFLRIPRRPKWTPGETTAEELDQMERDSFLQWRRDLALVQEGNQDLIFTPFERNLEVWRQLWRVIERSELVVQIVDARNPLLFRSPDLGLYVREVSKKKKNLLLINKADLLTETQRKEWAQYFKENKIRCVFFSAAEAQKIIDEHIAEEQKKVEFDRKENEKDDIQKSQPPEKNETTIEKSLTSGKDEKDTEKSQPSGKKEKVEEKIVQDEEEEEEEDDEEEEEDEDEDEEEDENGEDDDDDDMWEDVDSDENDDNGDEDDEDMWEDIDSDEEVEEEEVIEKKPSKKKKIVEEEEEISFNPGDDIKIYTREELLDLFVKLCPPKKTDERSTIGFVGYPNVGKSSTINVLCQEKKVAVAATPGKTKHFQTLNIANNITLCDCPGLVFPNLATTKAEMVCNGILPIDQLKDAIGPTTLICQRIPRNLLELTYGIKIIEPGEGDDPNRNPTASEFLSAFAYMRGFMKAGFGTPDEQRAARLILKDYVNGKLLFCSPPPGIEAGDFNREVFDSSIAQLKAAKLAKKHTSETTSEEIPKAQPKTKSGRAKENAGVNSDRPTTGPRHHMQYINQVDEDFFNQKHVKAQVKGKNALADFQKVATQGGAPSDPQGNVKSSKKHHKGKKGN